MKSPPGNALPELTLSLMFPPFPPVAFPDKTKIDPVVPELDVPDLNVKLPLTPVVPASDVCTM
jgi:hypothetical protein